MNLLRSFTIPVKGLKIGQHEFSWKLEADFFKAVNTESNINADLEAFVIFDKRSSMYILNIEIKGNLIDTCDRCLETIPIPIEGKYEFFIKQGTSEDEADLIFLESFDDELNIATYIYEYAVLSFPLIKKVECDDLEPKPCNTELLKKWEQETKLIEREEDKKSVWDALNKLNLDK